MKQMIESHIQEYNSHPEIMVSAPGTVNLLGGHTDYYEGLVIQAALNERMRVAVSRREDNGLRFYAAEFNERKKTTLSTLKYKREDRWANYPKGVIHRFLDAGHELQGLDITIGGTIPASMGLGTSSAICIALAGCLNELFGFGLSDDALIKHAVEGETGFLNLNTSISEALNSQISRKDEVIFLDVFSGQTRFIPFQPDKVKLVITYSNVPFVPAQEELAERRMECEKCLDLLKQKKSGHSLRDYTLKDLSESVDILPEASRRFCMHVLEENERVREGVESLHARDFVNFGKLMTRSHESLRDNYEVSCPEVDWLVKRAGEIDGVLGSRMTGIGFGGCTISLIREEAMGAYASKLEEYERIFGFTPQVEEVFPDAGVRTEDTVL